MNYLSESILQISGQCFFKLALIYILVEHLLLRIPFYLKAPFTAYDFSLKYHFSIFTASATEDNLVGITLYHLFY